MKTKKPRILTSSDKPASHGGVNSCANQILRARSKPVKLALKTILVPSDLSSPSDNAFKYALPFAQYFGAMLHVIHVLEPALSPEFAGLPGTPAFSKEELASAKRKFRAWADCTGVAVAAKLVFRNGFAVHEIVEAAKELDIDLVIMGTQGHTASKHLCIGRTAERVVRAAPCPVLVVREKET